MQCEAHPSVETELACGKCEKPICPRCLYHTPVGARCRECANIRRLPQYEISPAYLIRGLGAALGVGAAVGGFWGLLLPYSLSFFFGLLIGFGLGYAVGEAVSLAANRKAGPPLQALAVVGVLAAYLLRSALLATRFEQVGIVDAITNDTVGYIAVALAVFIAIGRLR